MNHYEELGIASDAPAEEIRQAYKTLVRLLHPDGQTDERLKTMAERQMQRLNGMLEILLDPRRRREYDEGIRGPRTAVVPWRRESPGAMEPSAEPVVSRWTEWVQLAVRYWIWVLVGTTCVGTAAVWWAMAPERSVTRQLSRKVSITQRSPSGRARAVATRPLSPKRSVRRSHRAMAPERSATEVLPAAAAQVPAPVVPEAAPLEKRKGKGAGRAREKAHEAQDAPLPAAEAATVAQGEGAASSGPAISAGVELRAPVVPEQATEAAWAEPSTKPNPKTEEWRFAGNWLYVPQAEGAAGTAYPAEYVELLLTEENGDLVGRYRAKHKVSDKAVPGEVDLRIRGAAPSGRKGRAEWTSGSGAKGVMEMTLRRPGLMNVAWWTTEFGRREELTSGSAVLVWQQAP